MRLYPQHPRIDRATALSTAAAGAHVKRCRCCVDTRVPSPFAITGRSLARYPLPGRRNTLPLVGPPRRPRRRLLPLPRASLLYGRLRRRSELFRTSHGPPNTPRPEPGGQRSDASRKAAAMPAGGQQDGFSRTSPLLSSPSGIPYQETRFKPTAGLTRLSPLFYVIPTNNRAARSPEPRVLHDARLFQACYAV